MVCKTCGSQLTEQDKFCRYCGTTVETAPQQPAPAYIPQAQGRYAPQPEAPQYEPPKAPQFEAPKHKRPSAPRKGGKKGLIIGGSIAGAILVLALVAVLILTGNPTVQVATAFKNTAETFVKIADVWHVEEVAATGKKEAVSITADVQLDTVSSEMAGEAVGNAVSGIGVRLDMDADLENREMGMMASIHKGSADLVTAMVSAEDAMLYVGLPDFLDDFYGLNTETAMSDLEAMGAGLGDAAQISFNIFELIEIVQSYSPDPEELEAELTKAVTDLVKDIEIGKEGKKDFKVGSDNLKCKAYSVVIPQDALESLLDVVLEATETDPIAMMEELCAAIHLPDYLTEELISEMRYSTPEADYDDIYEVLDILEDIELTVYVKSNKVAGIVYEKKIDGSKLKLTLGIGGEYYGDLFEVEVKADDEKVTVEFEGDHAARDGIFTDKATIKVDGEKITMDTEYDPRSGDLFLKLGDDTTSFRVEGIYTADDSSYTLDLNKIGFVQNGEEQFSISMLYQVSDYEKRVSVGGAKLLSDLNEDDIMSMATELEGNAMEWAMELVGKYPELVDLINEFM